MNGFIKQPVRHVLSSVALLFLLLAAAAPVAHAQIIFGAQLSDEGKEAVTGPMDAERLFGLLAEEGRLVYESENPVMAKHVVFFSDGEGKMHERVEGKPFELESGAHPAGKHFPGDQSLALFEKAFPDSTFDPDKRFPASAGPIDCADLHLSATAAPPLDTLRVSGIPATLADTLRAMVAVPGEADPRPVGLVRLAAGEAAFFVPVHPSGRREGGSVELRLEYGDEACAPVPFRIEALPAAPGTAVESVDRLEDLVRAQAGFFRTSPEALRSVNPADLPPVLAALRAADHLVGHPDNPNSLRAILTGEAPNVPLTPEERELMDALWARLDLPGRMRDHVAELSAGEPLSESVPVGSFGAAPAPTDGRRGPSAPVPLRFGGSVLTGSVLTRPSPMDLHRMMDQSNRSDIKMGGKAGEIWGQLEALLSTSAAMFSVAGPGGKVFGGLFAAEAGYATAYGFTHKALANLLPSEFVDAELTLSPQRFPEDDPGPGEIGAFTVTAASKGWTLDEAIAEQILGRVGIPKEIVSGPARTFWKQAKGQVDAAAAGAAGADAVRIPRMAFGPTDLMGSSDWRQWLDIHVIGDAVAYVDGAPTTYRFEPRRVGGTTLRVATRWDRFGVGDDRHLVAEATVGVDAIAVVLEPPSQEVQPGATVPVTAEVGGALDPSVVWSIESGGGQVVAERQVGSGMYGATVLVPDPLVEAVVVKATSTPDRSHLDRAPERSGTSRLHPPERLAVVPAPACLEPGETEDFGVTGLAERDVVWSASAGSITADGVLTVPAMSGVLTVAAAGRADASRRAEVEVRVSEGCACSPEVMGRAVNEGGFMLPLQSDAFGEMGEVMGVQAGRGTLRFSGLVSDGGVGCANPLAATGFDVGSLSNEDDEDAEAVSGEEAAHQSGEEAARQLQAFADRMAREVFGKPNSEAVTDEDLENMTPEQEARMAEMMGVTPDRKQMEAEIQQMEADRNSRWRRRSGDVVIPIFSPNTGPWLTGMLTYPMATRHGGVGDWRPNAAALLNLQLVGTEGADLEEGRTYPADAFATGSVERTPGRAPTWNAFYTRWDGRWVEDCGEIPGEMLGAIQQQARQLDPEGEWLDADDVGEPGCIVGTGYLLTGELSGTVTIEAITETEVVGTFSVSGPATLTVGSDDEERRESGALTVKGRFNAPTARRPVESNP